MNKKVTCLINILVTLITYTEVTGHGYVIQPPQRSSAWRKQFKVPPNYTDNELSCGGAGNQWNSVNDGRCGVCGDPYQATVKENEDIGGKYVTGTITGNYVSGSTMEVKVKITAYHLGWFEFRLCPLENSQTKVTQACLNQTLLHEADSGKSRFQLEQIRKTAAGVELYTFILALPDYTCENCVMQWWYNTGNSWGCEEAGCGVGYGKQERFVNCVDIRLYRNYTKDETFTQESTITKSNQVTTKSAIFSQMTELETTQTTSKATLSTTKSYPASTKSATLSVITSKFTAMKATQATSDTTTLSTTEAVSTEPKEPTSSFTATSFQTKSFHTTELNSNTSATATSSKTVPSSTETIETATSDKTSSDTNPSSTSTIETITSTTVPTAAKKNVCNCVALPPYNVTAGMTEWCCRNCPMFCPVTYCSCS